MPICGDFSAKLPHSTSMRALQNGDAPERQSSRMTTGAQQTVDSRHGPQLSYSSDDLRKQSSSASSSCISPTTDPHLHQPQPRHPPDSITGDVDAFQRVGSRRGVYRPHSNTTVVVHHPAIKEAERTLSDLPEPPASTPPPPPPPPAFPALAGKSQHAQP